MSPDKSVTVYYFTKYAIKSDENTVSKRPATLEAIERVCGSPLLETAQQISTDELDPDGFKKRDS